MRVSGLDKRGDWRFGRGKALYLKGSDAIAQKVITRLRSFKRDWFLDIDAGVDWIQLLGSRNSEDRILREVERIIVSTEGVLQLTAISIKTDRLKRSATIYASYKDVYGTESEFNEALEQ